MHQIDKVARFSEDCAADRGIRHPVGSGDSRRIDAATQHRGSGSFCNLLLHVQISWRVTPVESDGELFSGIFDGLKQVAAFLLRQRHGLFDKDVLSGLQRCKTLRSVQRIPDVCWQSQCRD